MSELKDYDYDPDFPFQSRGRFYDADEVDDVIAELKAENERLKDKLDAANNQCKNLINSATDIMLRQDKANDTKCADIEKLTAETRKLKRALYKACANWADVEVFERTVGIDDPNVEANRWALMRNKCLKKAEEYK